MTKKDFYNVIKDAMADNADVVAFCDNEIALLEKKAAKAKATAAAKKAEGDALTDAVFAVLTDEVQSTADIAAQIDGPDVTVAKVSYRLTQLVKNGKAVKSEIQIPAADGAKARKIAGYTVA